MTKLQVTRDATKHHYRRIAKSPQIAFTLVHVGRALIGIVYFVGGIEHIFNFSSVSQEVETRGLPFSKLMLSAGTAFQMTAGCCLVFDVWSALAALSLVLFTLMSSVLMLDFWNKKGELRASAIENWQSNIALIGGLLVVVSVAIK